MASDGLVDLTHPITCTITDWKLTGGHVEYEIECKRAFDETPWKVIRRYREFDALHKQLQSFGAPLRLPPKRLFGSTKERFVKERLAELQRYLQSLTVSPLLYASPHVVAFLGTERESERGSPFLVSRLIKFQTCATRS
uniref:PX domain-containing protein n=1 Tax=Steinernema glaseri TaxID=37863 RepID=A0A1I7ZDP6_9BILA